MKNSYEGRKKERDSSPLRGEAYIISLLSPPLAGGD